MKEETVIIYNRLTDKKIEVRKRALALFQMVGGDTITVLGEEPPKTKKMQVQSIAVAVPEEKQPENSKPTADTVGKSEEPEPDNRKAKNGPKRIDQ